jgi:hypothetical protein
VYSPFSRILLTFCASLIVEQSLFDFRFASTATNHFHICFHPALHVLTPPPCAIKLSNATRCVAVYITSTRSTRVNATVNEVTLPPKRRSWSGSPVPTILANANQTSPRHRTRSLPVAVRGTIQVIPAVAPRADEASGALRCEGPWRDEWRIWFGVQDERTSNGQGSRPLHSCMPSSRTRTSLSPCIVNRRRAERITGSILEVTIPPFLRASHGSELAQHGLRRDTGRPRLSAVSPAHRTGHDKLSRLCRAWREHDLMAKGMTRDGRIAWYRQSTYVTRRRHFCLWL